MHFARLCKREILKDSGRRVLAGLDEGQQQGLVRGCWPLFRDMFPELEDARGSAEDVVVLRVRPWFDGVLLTDWRATGTRVRHGMTWVLSLAMFSELKETGDGTRQGGSGGCLSLIRIEGPPLLQKRLSRRRDALLNGFSAGSGGSGRCPPRFTTYSVPGPVFSVPPRGFPLCSLCLGLRIAPRHPSLSRAGDCPAPGDSAIHPDSSFSFPKEWKR